MTSSRRDQSDGFVEPCLMQRLRDDVGELEVEFVFGHAAGAVRAGRRGRVAHINEHPKLRTRGYGSMDFHRIWRGPLRARAEAILGGGGRSSTIPAKCSAPATPTAGLTPTNRSIQDGRGYSSLSSPSHPSYSRAVAPAGWRCWPRSLRAVRRRLPGGEWVIDPRAVLSIGYPVDAFVAGIKTWF